MSARKAESAGTVTGSPKAKRYAAVILEVFAGIRGTTEASEAMGLSPNRYYQLEARALQGMIDCLEPRPRGRQRSVEDEVARLNGENERLQREVGRLQTLVRAAQRSLGVPAKSKASGKKKGSRTRKPSHRGKKVVAMLVKPADDGVEGEAKAS